MMKKTRAAQKQNIFGVHLSKELQQWVRQRASMEGRTITATTERAISAYRAMVDQSPSNRTENS